MKNKPDPVMKTIREKANKMLTLSGYLKPTEEDPLEEMVQLLLDIKCNTDKLVQALSGQLDERVRYLTNKCYEEDMEDCNK
jgi:hypothetical protein